MIINEQLQEQLAALLEDMEAITQDPLAIRRTTTGDISEEVKIRNDAIFALEKRILNLDLHALYSVDETLDFDQQEFDKAAIANELRPLVSKLAMFIVRYASPENFIKSFPVKGKSFYNRSLHFHEILYMEAVKIQNTEIMNILSNINGQGINGEIKYNGQTALDYAIATNNPAVVRALLEKVDVYNNSRYYNLDNQAQLEKILDIRPILSQDEPITEAEITTQLKELWEGSSIETSLKTNNFIERLKQVSAPGWWKELNLEVQNSLCNFIGKNTEKKDFKFLLTEHPIFSLESCKILETAINHHDDCSWIQFSLQEGLLSSGTIFGNKDLLEIAISKIYYGYDSNGFAGLFNQGRNNFKEQSHFTELYNYFINHTNLSPNDKNEAGDTYLDSAIKDNRIAATTLYFLVTQGFKYHAVNEQELRAKTEGLLLMELTDEVMDKARIGQSLLQSEKEVKEDINDTGPEQIETTIESKVANSKPTGSVPNSKTKAELVTTPDEKPTVLIVGKTPAPLTKAPELVSPPVSTLPVSTPPPSELASLPVSTPSVSTLAPIPPAPSLALSTEPSIKPTAIDPTASNRLVKLSKRITPIALISISAIAFLGLLAGGLAIFLTISPLMAIAPLVLAAIVPIVLSASGLIAGKYQAGKEIATAEEACKNNVIKTEELEHIKDNVGIFTKACIDAQHGQITR